MLLSRQVWLVAISLAYATGGHSQTPGSLPEAEHTTIGFPTAAAALKSLEARPGVTFKTEPRAEGDWIIAIDESASTVGSFAPKGHTAYPAAVKRTVVARGAKTLIQTDVLCEAAKVACDKLFLDNQKLTARVTGAK